MANRTFLMIGSQRPSSYNQNWPISRLRERSVSPILSYLRCRMCNQSRLDVHIILSAADILCLVSNGTTDIGRFPRSPTWCSLVKRAQSTALPFWRCLGGARASYG